LDNILYGKYFEMLVLTFDNKRPDLWPAGNKKGDSTSSGRLASRKSLLGVGSNQGAEIDPSKQLSTTENIVRSFYGVLRTS
jgi:hypothetical protein